MILLALSSSLLITPIAAFSTGGVVTKHSRTIAKGSRHLRASLQTPRPENAATTNAATTNAEPSDVPSYILSVAEMKPLLKWEKNGKEKILNAVGMYHLAIIALTMPFWMAAMDTLHIMGDAIEGFDENRAKFDYAGKVWCRSYLKLTNCYPVVAGDVSRLKVGGGSGACLFVANHASFLDIAVLCCVLDPVFKFIAKDSLKDFPGVGKQLVGGEHVLIDRSDKRSQLRTFKQAINYLKTGVPIMAFPEGKRSPDGRLMEFKGGIFSMAVKAKVPIVPLSIANAHAVMPGVGLLPVQSGAGKLRVFVHDAISVEGKSEEEIATEVRETLLSELPWDQHPLETDNANVAYG